MTLGKARSARRLRIATATPRPDQNAFEPKDFMPSYGRKEPEPEKDDGMAPEHVMGVMQRLMQHQKKVAGRA